MTATLGLRAFTDACRHFHRRQLRPYIWLPGLTSLIVISTGAYFAFNYLAGLTDALVAALPEWLSFLEMLLTPLIYLFGVLIGAWSFAFLAVLISSPFLGAFSLAVERTCFGASPPHEEELEEELETGLQTGLWTDISGSFSRELRKLLYYLPRLVAVFLVTLIPVINLAAPFIWLVFGAWTMAVQFVDYPVENRGQPFQNTLTRLHENRVGALAFGACTAAALSIPLLNFLLIPVAVTGGTLFWRYSQGDALG